MSTEKPLKPVSQLLAGRWQIPLALVAATAGGLALYRLLPRPAAVDFAAALADVAVLEQSGDPVSAADSVANLLEAQPPLPPEQRAELHERLADLIYRVEGREPVHNPGNIKKLLDNSRAARDLERPATPGTLLRDATAFQWLGEFDKALVGFRTVLDQPGISVDLRREAVRGLVDVLERRPESKLERRQLLEDLLADETLSSPYVWWALQRAVQDALDGNDTLRARELLQRHGHRLRTSDLKGYLDYLWACVMVHEGRPQEAEPLVRWIDEWLGRGARSTRELDNFGHLPSLNRWLMGRIHLAEDRPQDALGAFDEALRWQPNPILRIAANVGRGTALAALDRHDAAAEAFRAAQGDLAGLPRPHEQAVLEMQKALLDLFEQQRDGQDFGNALRYLSIAAEVVPQDKPERKRALLERLAEAARSAAGDVAGAALAREFHEVAGRSFDRAAELVRLDESRYPDLLWAAADEYDRAGRLSEVRRILEGFVQGRANHPRMPRALLLLGQACEGTGDLEQARYWYQRLADEYPRLEETARARVLTARLLLSLGAEHYADAERLLSDLVNGDYVAPDASVYRDALLALCELLYYQERYGEAIGRIEDFLALYPRDAEGLQGRFLLANAYRRSAFALRDRAASEQVVPADAAQPRSREADAAGVSAERFRRAAELYEELLDTLSAPAAAADARTPLYTRLALFYRADCLFELNEPAALEAALAIYRNAAARYEGHPTALIAHVQIANIHLRQGNVTEAARAIERARWLLRTIPEEEFAEAGNGSRADWERFLDTVLESSLFRGVFAACGGSPRPAPTG